jgi:hypothetical protein
MVQMVPHVYDVFEYIYPSKHQVDNVSASAL